MADDLLTRAQLEQIRRVVREEVSAQTRLPEFMSVNDTAARLDVTINTVYKLLNDQKIESVYIGKRNRKVVAESLRDYMENLPHWPE